MERGLDPRSHLRPADLLFPRWDGRRALAVDLSIRHPCPPSLHPITHSAATALIDHGKRTKRELYRDVCDATDSAFAPVFLTTWGSLEAEAVPFFRDLVKRLYGDEDCRERSSLRSQFLESLGFRLMRFVGAHLQDCVAGCLDPDLPVCPIPRTRPLVVAPSRSAPRPRSRSPSPPDRRSLASPTPSRGPRVSPSGRKRGRSATRRQTSVGARFRTTSAPSQSSPSSCAAVVSSPYSPQSPARKSLALEACCPVLSGPLFPPFPPPSPTSFPHGAHLPGAVSSLAPTPLPLPLMSFDPTTPWLVPFPDPAPMGMLPPAFASLNPQAPHSLADFPYLPPIALPQPRQPRPPRREKGNRRKGEDTEHGRGKEDRTERAGRADPGHPT